MKYQSISNLLFANSNDINKYIKFLQKFYKSKEKEPDICFYDIQEILDDLKSNVDTIISNYWNDYKAGMLCLSEIANQSEELKAVVMKNYTYDKKSLLEFINRTKPDVTETSNWKQYEAFQKLLNTTFDLVIDLLSLEINNNWRENNI